MPNPSLIAEQLHERREELIDEISNAHSKAAKEEALRRLREVEDALGIEHTRYNSSAFGKGGKHEQSPSDDGSTRRNSVDPDTARSLSFMLDRDIARSGPSHSFMINASRLRELLDFYFANAK